MDQNEIWERLEIAPTKDKKAIRRAYAARSREHHMEEEPELFRKISEAYQQALQGAELSSVNSSAFSGTQQTNSLLSQLEEAEEEKLQKTFSSGALSEMLAIMNDSEKRDSAAAWREYFLSSAFLNEQFDESFGKGMFEYFANAPGKLLSHLPQNFVMELAVAFGLLPDAIKVGEAKRDKRGKEYWDCVYRVNGEGSFYNRQIAAELYNCQEDAGGERARHFYQLLVEQSENRLRAESFSNYIMLRNMNKSGCLDVNYRGSWEKMLLGGQQNECFICLLEYWVSTDEVPESVLCFMYDSYALKDVKDIENSGIRKSYSGLKKAVLHRIPGIEEILYGEDSIIYRRKRWQENFHKVLIAHQDNYEKDIFEDTGDIQKCVYDLFHEEDWEALKKDVETFQDIHAALAERSVIPQTMADFLLDFYEKEGDFAEPDRIWELTLGLLRSKGFMRRMKEADVTKNYIYTKTSVEDIDADNEEFVVYLLSRGFGSRYIPVIGEEEKNVPYIKQNRLYLPAFLDEIYHPFFIKDVQWNPTPGWQKVFTHFDEQENDILEPVRDEVTLPDGNKLTAEFHLHYILFFWNGEQVVEPAVNLTDLKRLAGKMVNPIHFLYLLAVTEIEGSERMEARELIYGWLEKTCIYLQLRPMLAQLLSCDNARLPIEENEARRVVTVCYGEQERFCFRMTVCRRNVKLYRQTRYGWEEMKLLDGEGKKAKSQDIEGKIAFCKEKLQKLRQPAPVLLSHREVSELSSVEKARAILDAMKEGEIARKNRSRPYLPGFPWRPDEITDSVRDFFARDGGWMTESYCVLHMGQRAGKQFERVFWAKMNIFGFDLGFMLPEFCWSLDENIARMTAKIPEKHLMVGYFGWGKRYSPKGWMEPMALAVGESGTYYMHDFTQLYEAQTVEEVLAKTYSLLEMVTAIDVYEGKLTVSKFDHALEYCYTEEDYQAWLNHKTTELPEVFTKFGI